ncbi:MAG: mechanosensitive ion channel [Vicingaceae bacterium]
MIEEFRSFLVEYFINSGISEFYSEALTSGLLLIIAIILGFIVDRISRQLLLTSFISLAKKSKTDWDDLLVENKVFSAIAHLIPVLFIFYLLPQIVNNHTALVDYFDRIAEVVIIFVTIQIIFRVLNTIKTILSRIETFKDKPLQSYFQLVKIIVSIILGILILSILANKSVMYFFGAFGAMTAVLLLVFKDTILGFIASIQLAANDMIRVGDWVAMERYGADGDVIEINLTTVKVKNWDKTITTVPTYSFISDSFKNWRGMQETGARRIARSVFINQQTVKFADEKLISRFKNIHILKNYVEGKETEIKKYNEERKVDVNQVSNGRRMTNLGTFRAYLLEYLKNHPKINQELTVLVRQQDPSPNGIPIQIYAFSNDIAWVNYEAIQSDIFDHILAVVHQFELEIFQNPTGTDFRSLATKD